ncbi:MAG TPA: hypothetical protein VN181_05115 [Thermoanaerobaculia bacterium]|nr:hypothetical protein [Thermoanaerobaculia bacterium]
MSSPKISDDPYAVDFERDMPTTTEDITALERARNLTPLSPGQYQQWVDLIAKHHGVREDRCPFDTPFEL